MIDLWMISAMMFPFSEVALVTLRAALKKRRSDLNNGGQKNKEVKQLISDVQKISRMDSEVQDQIDLQSRYQINWLTIILYFRVMAWLERMAGVLLSYCLPSLALLFLLSYWSVGLVVSGLWPQYTRLC